MTIYRLKWIAIITMTLDHIAVIFPDIPFAIALRIAGRFALPIFAFCIARGYWHTRDYKRYLLRLTVFAIAIEASLFIAGFEIWRLNIFFTLALGLVALKLLHHAHYGWFLIPLFIIIGLVPFDYGLYGVLLIIAYGAYKTVWPGLILSTLVMGIVPYFTAMVSLQYFALMANVLFIAYRGVKGRSMKWFFYLYYPLHILILYAISILFF